MTDLDLSSGCWQPLMAKHLACLQGTSLAAVATEDSFVDLFPKERLVYLTPDASDMLQTFDCDDVYLIGAIVDTAGTQMPRATFAKAKQLGIRTAKLPLDKYLK